MTSDEPERVVIRDNRKIDPVTGEARKVAAEAEADPSAAGAGDDSILDTATSALLAERTADLQRVQAEYANYRKRADRERLAASEVAVGGVLAMLLPVLDNLDRAREHGDLTGGLKAVADQLDEIVTRLGLAAFGEVGEPFDPARHEAVLHNESDEVTEPSVTIVMRPGYTHGDRLIRAAMVGVTDPASSPSDPGTATSPNPPNDLEAGESTSPEPE